MPGADLHPDQLSHMRDSMTASLPGTAEIWAPTPTSDGQGGTTVVFAAVTLAARSQPGADVDDPTKTTLAARLASAGQSDPDRTRGDGQQVRVPWVITLPYGADVRDDDRIVMAGRTFEVQYDASADRTYQLSTRVRVVELR